MNRKTKGFYWCAGDELVRALQYQWIVYSMWCGYIQVVWWKLTKSLSSPHLEHHFDRRLVLSAITCRAVEREPVCHDTHRRKSQLKLLEWAAWGGEKGVKESTTTTKTMKFSRCEETKAPKSLFVLFSNRMAAQRYIKRDRSRADLTFCVEDIIAIIVHLWLRWLVSWCDLHSVGWPMKFSFEQKRNPRKKKTKN